ncbi:hypothetical protein FJV41_47570 [Myxococcus llanfairpwllgwyngyllgogerychwyrndrobwllllantysiliogogogochensis]|uniref:Uncharacterized protein n=1 Tax=Myxococcus llanfairpwllgwyngyllgogerychwyrndrobwllllantysiliogogogochensis TaxID=2590453 RepID=A0A540WIP1_9BACT|nr:hypothetical protein [Myxococcus llanfairpwllgwyngyllgogerychwyrndrobwllllantysiliogogogochensis]TQF08880.1 hypothetical protein FJV41_47570 [Myxococcus llanfairpwllgwyngyllgogerychwyrndrobwllllantysiliogogogochensis]
MSDYLSHLVARQYRPTEGVRPRITSYFAPEAQAVERDEASLVRVDTEHEQPGALPRAPIGPVRPRREPWSVVGQTLSEARSTGGPGPVEIPGTVEPGSFPRGGTRGALSQVLDTSRRAPGSGPDEAQAEGMGPRERSFPSPTRVAAAPHGRVDEAPGRTGQAAPKGAPSLPFESRASSLATPTSSVIQRSGIAHGDSPAREASPLTEGLVAGAAPRTDLRPVAAATPGAVAPTRSPDAFAAVQVEHARDGQGAVARPSSVPAESSVEEGRSRTFTTSEQGPFDARPVTSAVGRARALSVALETSAPAPSARSSTGTTRQESAESPASRNTSQAPAEPVIQVTIGRIEVRAVTPAAPARSAPTRPSPSPSLEEYLARRNGGGR